MRIVILGPSASGKTTIANKISDSLHFNHLNQDLLLFKYDIKNKTRIKLGDKERKKMFLELQNSDSWVFEGIIPFKRLLDIADYIIYVDSNLLICIYRQWKRYFTDSDQRKKFGLINNIKLSVFIISQFATLSWSKGLQNSMGRTRIKELLDTQYSTKTIYMDGSDTKNIPQSLLG